MWLAAISVTSASVNFDMIIEQIEEIAIAVSEDSAKNGENIVELLEI